MTRKTIKDISIVLLVLATLLLILDIIHVKMVYKTEKGLWDFIPDFLREVVFIAYPILFFTSYISFAFCRKVKTKYDFVANILFLLNGLVIVIILIVYFTELVKKL